MFDTTKEDLRDILRDVNEGKLQLPDFQRSYVWGDSDVRSLIASIAKGFPVGALLTLETGGEVRFKPRLLAGVAATDRQPNELLLDGQQRMTSLFQATFSKHPVRTKNTRDKIVERHYYLDIRQCVDGITDLEQAIVGVPGDKITRTNFGRDIQRDLSTREAEFEHQLFPLDQVFDSRDWLYDWRDYWKAKGEDVSELDRNFVRGTLDAIERYKMPIIRLDRNNSREAICLVFEKVNVGGKKLDAFELVTAIYAAEEFDLRTDWLGDGTAKQPGRRATLIGLQNRCDVLTKIASTDFLQACTLLHTRDKRLAREQQGYTGKELPQVSCNRDALLALPVSAYKQYADTVQAGFIAAGHFLNELKIIWHKDIPYPPQRIALAATFAILGNKAQTAVAKQQLAQWFWSVTLGELYGSSTESRLARDVPELVAWIGGGGHPRSIDEALFQQDRLLSLRSRLSAAYKGVHALLMGDGCRDFITGRQADLMTFFQDKIDIHHIFPQAWCKKHSIKADSYNAIVNKTPLFKLTNIELSGDAPSIYLKRIEDKHGLSPTQLDDILRSHRIEPQHLRNDDYQAFFAARSKALSELISTAMAKPVVLESGSDEQELDPEPELADHQPADADFDTDSAPIPATNETA